MREGDQTYKAKGLEFREFEKFADGDQGARPGWTAASEGEGRFQQVALSPQEQAGAKLLYGTNRTLRNNIKRTIERAAGHTFTGEQIKSILGDVLKGKSTTREGLGSFSHVNPNSGEFSPEQVRTIDTYVRELPGSPLNDSIKRDWQSYLGARGKASR